MNAAFDLSGKKIFVTGASSGIGRAICQRLAAQGATIFATGRDAGRLDATLVSLGAGQHRALVADLGDEGALAGLVEALPPLDGVVHCAGVGKAVPFKFITPKELHATQRINYEAPVLLTQRLLKDKRVASGASLVFIASVAGVVGSKGYGVYSGSKGAVIAMARSLAMELAPQKIRVNCVAPGMVRTTMATEAEATISTQAMQDHERAYPLGFGEPDDVAAPVAFLLSSASRWITGECLVIDGGYSAH